MYKKFLVLTMALFLALALFIPSSYAAEGDNFSVTGFRVDAQGEMGYKALNEIVVTNDTVTAAETGKVFLISNGAAYNSVIMTLPAANEGLTYTFIQQGTDTKIQLAPNGTDQFLYSSADASDHLIGPATVGASVTVHASSDTVWFVDANGTFTVAGY